MMYDGGLMGVTAYNYALNYISNGTSKVSVFSLSGHILAQRGITGRVNGRLSNDAIVTFSGQTYLATNFNEFAIAGTSLNLTNAHWSDSVYASSDLSLVFSRGEDNNWGSIDKLASDFPISTEYLWITCAIANDRTVLIIADNSTVSVPIMISIDNGVTFQNAGIFVYFYGAKSVAIFDSSNYAVYGVLSTGLGDHSGNPLLLRVHNSAGWHDVTLGNLTISRMIYDDADNMFLLCADGTISYKLYKLTVSTQVLTLLYTEAYVAQNIGGMTIIDEMIFISMTRRVRILSKNGTLINDALVVADSLNIYPSGVSKNF